MAGHSLVDRNYAGRVPGNKQEPDRTLITSAAPSRTLDADERNKRYLITMLFRTGFFIAFLIVPGWWKIVCLLIAALLPALAVLLANASDNRPQPVVAGQDDGDNGRAALPGSAVIEGTVVESE